MVGSIFRGRAGSWLCQLLVVILGLLPTPLAVAGTLRLTAYCTVDSARAWLRPVERDDAVSKLKYFGIEKVIVEVNRGATALTEEEAKGLKDSLVEAGLEVAGGIATVPGGDWGVPANAGLAWMNFQSAKTRSDTEASFRRAARVFDTVVVDDFLLTADTSAESESARGKRSWGAYRRDLMTSFSQRAIIGPAKEENPDVQVIVKFPQSYDRYQEFGYDTSRMPQLYNGVWVGTETRGQYTQRFGFTQPYEGFVNYRWIASLSRGKMGAAWFDFGDCDATDFVEQAWQSVLAGTTYMVLFSVEAITAQHPGLELLREDRPALEKLAEAIRQHPVSGVAAYKPPNSAPANDMYIMDFVGMLGVPLVPVSTYPDDADTLFIPAQGGHDPDIAARIEASVLAGKNVVVTAGLLGGLGEDEGLAHLAGLAAMPKLQPIRTETVLLDGETVNVPRGLDLAGTMEPEAAEILLEALVDGQSVPFLTSHAVGSGRLSVLNIQMFTQGDFDAVNEVLLSPRNPGLLDIPSAWASTLRRIFRAGGEVQVDAPTRVTIQPMGDSGWFIQNYNKVPVEIRLAGAPPGKLVDGFTGAEFSTSGNALTRTLAARSRLWIQR